MNILSSVERLSYLYHMHITPDYSKNFWAWLAENDVEPTEDGITNFYVQQKRKLNLKTKKEI